MSVLLVILVLSFLVVIHELGHLLVALWCRIGVEEFGLGYPPKIKEVFRWRKIPFTLNWIPFGGFVRLQGEDAQSGSPVKKGDFRLAGRAQRTAVILAGVTVNFLFGVIVFSAIFTVTGIPVALHEARVTVVQEGAPAAQAHLPANVTIKAVESSTGRVLTASVSDVQKAILAHRGETVTLVTTGLCQGLTCDPAEGRYQVAVRTTEQTPPNQGAIGVVFQSEVLIKYPVWQMPIRGAIYGTLQALKLGRDIVLALGSLAKQLVLSGQLPADVVGPIGIASQAQQLQLANQGWLTIVLFAAMISINLAVMNILPIPPLDGGHLLFVLLEPLMRRSRLEKIEYWLNYSGFVILIIMIVLISIRDVWKIIV